MITIDGKDGGGQILRTSIGLSALTGDPIRVKNIRLNKSGKTGLRPQHMTGIKVVAQFCDAEVYGLEEGSFEVEFTPKELQVCSGRIDIGTAGSVTLLLQTLLPILLFSKKPVSLDIIGGTEVKWSPTVQYHKNITLPLIRKLGGKIDLEILKHGYYPKGGGMIRVTSKPIRRLNSWECETRGEIKTIFIQSTCSKLPKDVAKRQGGSSLREIQMKYPKTKVSMVYKGVNSSSPGSSCTCFAVCENSILGSSSLGGRGLKAERVGIEASEELMNSLDRGACLDKYMADQILPFFALARGKSEVSVEGFTNHVVTNIQTIERMLDVKFKVKNKKISVEGIGWEG